ncbi:hypothetical protein AVEN_12593-1 [Araneus ventricosus]|uniref:Uncharacterized protein n=1 Tax=Araneus ventricosus TaxID=182803 RepID=A0A4Y2ABF7_ARAVE|nr:hypothetical protein AVEN_12593-1 [Araneus ventricosus]
MGAEGPHVDHKTARMAISLEVFCSWTIMKDPTQQGAQKNTFVVWDGIDWIIRPTDLHLFPALKTALSGRHFRRNEEVAAGCEELPSLPEHRFLPGWLL